MKFYNTPTWALVPTHISFHSTSASLLSFPLCFSYFSVAATKCPEQQQFSEEFIWVYGSRGNFHNGGGMAVEIESISQPYAGSRESKLGVWVYVWEGCKQLNSPSVMSFFPEGPTSQNYITSPNSATYQGPSEQIHESVGDNPHSNHQAPLFLATLSFFLSLSLSQPFLFPTLFQYLRFCSVPSHCHHLPTILQPVCLHLELRSQGQQFRSLIYSARKRKRRLD